MSDMATYWQRYRQGNFSHCTVTPWGQTCTHTYPWIKMTMWAGGLYKTAGDS